MQIDSQIAAGFAVAAIVAGDTALASARAGLAPDLAFRLAPPSALGRAQLPALLAAFTPPFPPAVAVPARLRAVAGPRLPPDVAAEYLVGVPLPRPGHRPSDALRDWARRALHALGQR